MRGAEPDDDVVVRADEHGGVVAVEQRAEGAVERLGPRFPRRPERAAPLLLQLDPHRVRQLDEAREVGRRRRARRTPRRYAEIWSILPRIVRRLRCAPS